MFINRSIIFCAFAAFGGWVFGYDTGYISGCLIMPEFIKQFGEDDGTGNMVLTSSRQSIITASVSAGTFVGAFAQSYTSDKFGRKKSIMIWSVVFVIGSILQVTAFEYAQLSVGRGIAGLSVGAMSAIVPLYIGEAAPKRLRGALLVLYQLQNVSGLLLAYIMNLATHKIPNSGAYRVPIGIQIAWGLMLLIGSMLLPESPRWLLGRDEEDKAILSLASLNDTTKDDPVVEEAMQDLHQAIRIENEDGRAGWLECFSSHSMMWKRTLNGMMVQFLQQLNGQNYYFYYGPVFFEAANTGLSPFAIQVILGAVAFVMVLPAMWTMDHVGRRKSLLIGAILQAICALIAGLTGHFYTDRAGVSESTRTMGGQLLVAFAVLHITFFSLFWGPTPWVLLGETFPLRVRAKSISLGAATNWFWNFMLSFFSPRIAADIGPLILLIFAGALLYAFCYVFVMLPETKGLSLEEVDELYRTHVRPWRSEGWTPTYQRRGDVDSSNIKRERMDKMSAQHVEDTKAAVKDQV